MATLVLSVLKEFICLRKFEDEYNNVLREGRVLHRSPYFMTLPMRVGNTDPGDGVMRKLFT